MTTPHTDVMLDLETLGTSNDAAIVSIGAVAFNADGDNAALFTNSPDALLKQGAAFKVNVDASSPHAGQIDAGTVEWWLQQSDDARSALLEGPRFSLSHALALFDNWLYGIIEHADREKGSAVRLWSNGPTFDEVIIRSAYRRTGRDMNRTVSFRGSRCCRTMQELAETHGWQRDWHGATNTLAHDAMHDAIYQARNVVLQRAFIGDLIDPPGIVDKYDSPDQEFLASKLFPKDHAGLEKIKINFRTKPRD